ncbi:hypothetical protein FGRMN_2755 [Fusarium graminum]|nr:hypothetical protein FGRMN_2755 [Fusarium graminum]
MYAVTLAGLTVALATLASARPQGIGTSSNACPPGCASFVDSEHDHPDPHQLYHFQQLTDNHSCEKGAGCEISSSEVKGVSKGLSAGVSGDGWISAGFEVSSYEEFGTVDTCYGDPGDIICIFWRTANTMYGVSRQAMECCQKDGEPWDTAVTSPNKNNVGSTSVCGRNEQCQFVGYEYWNNMEAYNGGVTVAGGPQPWKFGGEVSGLVPDNQQLPEDKV